MCQLLINALPETWVLTPSNLVHLQHGNHVDDKRIGYGPNRDEDSPLAFSERCKDETHDKSPNAIGPTNFQIPADGINPCGLPPL